MTSIQGQSGQEENNFCFGFFTDADENIDFNTQYLANNRIFGDTLVDFRVSIPSCKYMSKENRHLTQFLIMSMDL